MWTTTNGWLTPQKKPDYNVPFTGLLILFLKWIQLLELIIDLGFQRILTSGGQATAINGLNQIMKLITKANGRIEIMAGSGVNASNIKTIKASGVDAAHFSIRKKQNRIVSLNMGAQYEVDEEKMLNIIKTLTK
jgi:copper homeostasis protein